MINKKYICPLCGSEIKCRVSKPPIESSVNQAGRNSYLYEIGCSLYACDLPVYSYGWCGKADDERFAYFLYDTLVERYKEYNHDQQLRDQKNRKE